LVDDHGIEAHVASGLFLEDPHITITLFDHMRLTTLEAGGHVASKSIRRLDRVVIDADKNQIFNFHCFPLRIRACCCA